MKSISKLTVVILTKNNQQTIRAQIEELKPVGQIIVVDDFSTDDTRREAKLAGAKVVQAPVSKDFAAARNMGLATSANTWVLFLDSDERLGPGLIKQIAQAIEESQYSAFSLARRDLFMGRVLLYGENGSNRFVRLVRKDSGQFVRPVHEYWQTDEAVGRLTGFIFHELGNDISRFIDKLDFYSSQEVELRRQNGQRFKVWQMIVYPLAKFMNNIFIRKGIMDGIPGVSMALLMSLHSLMVRIKLYEYYKYSKTS